MQIILNLTTTNYLKHNEVVTLPEDSVTRDSYYEITDAEYQEILAKEEARMEAETAW